MAEAGIPSRETFTRELRAFIGNIGVTIGEPMFLFETPGERRFQGDIDKLYAKLFGAGAQDCGK